MLTEGTNTIAPAADNATESANDESHLLSFMILFPMWGRRIPDMPTVAFRGAQAN